jgi:membrane protein implicated in regulation of membrane protease activity
MVSLFDPNTHFEPAPKRSVPRHRTAISWGATGLIIVLLFAGTALGLPGWISVVLTLALLVAITVLSRRWAKQDADAQNHNVGTDRT